MFVDIVRYRVFALVIAALGLSAPAARGQAIDHEAQYAACMQLADRDPHQAFEAAISWAGQGGGDAAQHCAAVSLIRQGQYPQGAYRLEVLVKNSTGADAALRADMLAQAAQAWMLYGDLDRALKAANASLTLNPSDPQLYVDRAVIRGQRREYQSAVQDLNTVLKVNPNMAEALVYRATANRNLNALEHAMLDLNRALRIAPDFPEALLERGAVRLASGDGQGAKQDWLRVALVAPNTPAADAAQKRIQELELR